MVLLLAVVAVDDFFETIITNISKTSIAFLASNTIILILIEIYLLGNLTRCLNMVIIQQLPSVKVDRILMKIGIVLNELVTN